MGTSEELPKSVDPAGHTGGSKGGVKGWIAAMKPPASATTHRKWGTSDGGGSDQQQRWSNGGSSGVSTPQQQLNGNGSLWSPEVASAMGYGKK